ncbi:nitroreductase family deazaflavin-dependent oxidoreductase [Candidatus Actinomarina]|nr:nitroreductase family deazaflavin-dependent oxidoreductase [Candidatus Actinomarina sp.]
MKSRISKLRRYFFFGIIYIHNYLYIYSDGRFGKFLNNRPCLILYTKGAKTQIERKNVLVFLKEGNEICLVASKGGNKNNPGWYHNLKKFQKCKIQIGRDSFEANAREVLNEERSEWWAKMDFMNRGGYSAYQTLTTRKIPVMVLTIS